jgi:hypothetical protein
MSDRRTICAECPWCGLTVNIPPWTAWGPKPMRLEVKK